MSDWSILIVDDDVVVSRAIRAALAEAGYRTRAANTCSDGLALAVKEMPRLLVLDIGLPDGSGWGLLEGIRRARPDACVPVIVISSDRVTRTQLREYSVDRFVSKPFDMALFVGTVRELLRPP